MKDEQIIGLFFARSELGIQALDAKYGGIFHKLSYNIVNNRQDAEECVNDAYLGTWNTIPPANPSPLLTYVCKIVRNLSLKVYYKNEAAKRSSTYTIAMEEIEPYIAGLDTVEAELETRELSRIIESFLDTLPIEDRIIFMRRYWFSDSYRDIAAFVGLSEKNISARLIRIRQKMRLYLMERMERPTVNVYGGDYDFELNQNYQIMFYEGIGSLEEQIISYNLKSVRFTCNSDGALWLVSIGQTELSEKVGDYPIISAEDARQCLVDGKYITDVPYELPGKSYIQKTELVYRAGEFAEYCMPYYLFYVELPQERHGELKTYGAYYVPAVDPTFISE